jgi:nucleoside-diphosphate-sugar epimerase
VKILVTGATGLIGCHAAAALARGGHEVRALVRDPEKLARVMSPFGVGDAVAAHPGDVTDPASIEAGLRGCDALLHCAGRFSHALEDAGRLQSVNVRGSELVLQAGCKAGLERIVFVSSALALFPPPGPLLRASDPVTSPQTMYAASKAEAERRARALQDGGAPIVIVYPFSVLGPHDPTVGSGPGVMAAALRAGRILVTDGGLAYTDVRDLADLFTALFAASAPPPRVMATAAFVPHERYFELLTLLTGRTDLARLRIPGGLLRGIGRAGDWAQRWLGRSTQLTAEAAQILTRSVPADDRAARALLGREPTAVEDSLRDTIAWMARAGVLAPRFAGRLASPAPTRDASRLH